MVVGVLDKLMYQCLTVIRRLLILPLCVIGISVAHAAPSELPSVFEPDDSYMVVVKAKQGEINQSAAGKYILKLRKVDMNNIMAMGERSLDASSLITLKDFKKLWQQVQGKVAPKPHKAVVVIGDKMQTVQLVGISYDENQIVFEIKEDSPVKAMKGKNVSVYIDDISIVANAATPTSW